MKKKTQQEHEIGNTIGYSFKQINNFFSHYLQKFFTFFHDGRQLAYIIYTKNTHVWNRRKRTISTQKKEIQRQREAKKKRKKSFINECCIEIRERERKGKKPRYE